MHPLQLVESFLCDDTLTPDDISSNKNLSIFLVVCPLPRVDSVCSNESRHGKRSTAAYFTLLVRILQHLVHPQRLSQVLGLHLPVMKLCVGSAACVIENRLESEDSELERRLLRVQRSSLLTRRDSSSGHLSSAPTRHGENPAPTMSSKAAAASDAAVSHNDIPLSHTWHGPSNNSNVAQPGPDHDDGDVVTASRYGGGSATNLLRPAKLRGPSRARAEQDYSSPRSGTVENEPAEGTPGKSVKFKFAAGKKKTPDGVVFDGLGDGRPSGDDALVASAIGAAKTTGEQPKDPRAAVLNVTVQARVWADYFNNTLRCWESLLDPFRSCFVILFIEYLVIS